MIEAVAELFQKQSQTHDLLGKLLSDLASLEAQTQLQKRVWSRKFLLPSGLPSLTVEKSALMSLPLLFGRGVCV